MLTERQLSLKRTVKQQLVEGNVAVDYVELEKFASGISNLLFKDLSKEEVEQVVAEITEEELVVLTTGGTVYNPSSFKKWLEVRRETTTLTRWNAYKQLLIARDWERSVIDDLEYQTDEIVELLGDPTDPTDWARRGLLLGEVQSGKTATYIGVLNKAIDFGYRLIVVIGGHTNDLRRQTQARMDFDLIGYDTSLIGENIATTARPPMGVAEYDSSILTNVLTTVENDFSKAKTRNALNWIQDTLPTVLVIKKNATLIRNVTKYIKQQTNGGRLDMPLVLIDDEADWGTPNTGSDTDPTKVNAAIRGLLDTSRRSSYLGITATPFANIFIDHAAENDDLGQDLFPADYIRVMTSPSTYWGIQKYFSSENTAIRLNVEDSVALLPIKHKKTHPVEQLPNSLEEAVMTFYLGTALRLHRRNGAPQPASMMVNISRFNDVQRKISDLTKDFSRELNSMIISEVQRSEGTLTSDLGKRLSSVWKLEYLEKSVTETWDDIKPWLVEVARSIRVELINSSTSGKRTKRRKTLTSEQRADEDLKPTIFVGGDVLARGLTLEGLQVSYFVREPRAMDTLMQMGRWFGYRPGYDDIVRIWMQSSTMEDFVWSAEVNQELRDLLLEMRAKKLTPRDFGLRLRAHPSGFEVVAANKRQSAELVSSDILIHGNQFESYYLDVDPNVRHLNKMATEVLLTEISSIAAMELTSTGYQSWRKVPLSIVENFFTKFRSDSRDPYFGFAPGDSVPQIASYLAEAESGDMWDIVLVSGSSAEVKLGEICIPSSLRNTIRRDGDTFELGNRRVATASNLLGALTSEARASLKEKLAGHGAITEAQVLENIKNPMMLIYALTTAPDKNTGEPPKVNIPASDPLIAVVLAFPAIDAEEANKRITARKVQKFWVNTVWWNNMRGYLDDGDDSEVGDEV